MSDKVKDNWKHRSENMRCGICMHFNEYRCRRHAPTMQGFPAVYPIDWCGDHKIDKESMQKLKEWRGLTCGSCKKKLINWEEAQHHCCIDKFNTTSAIEVPERIFTCSICRTPGIPSIYPAPDGREQCTICANIMRGV